MRSSHVRASRRRIAQAYAKFPPENLLVRDLLALDRTTLANERTLLAYIRTALAIAAAGGVIIKFSPKNITLIVLGAILIVSAMFVLFFGYRRYFRTRKALLLLNEPPHP